VGTSKSDSPEAGLHRLVPAGARPLRSRRWADRRPRPVVRL